MNVNRHWRVRSAVRGLGLTVLLWAVLIALADWRGAHWPHDNDVRQNVIVFGIIIEFLWLKSWMMASMTQRWDRLGVSLVAANVAFSAVYLYAMSIALFGQWRGIATAQTVVRVALILILAWGILQLLLVPDPDEDPEPPGRLEAIPTSWDRSAAANERNADASERSADAQEELVAQGVAIKYIHDHQS